MKKTIFALASLSLLQLACLTPIEGPADSGNNSQRDASSGADRSGGSDAASQDRATTGTDAGGGTDVMAMDFGGFDITGFDAGVIEYDGGSEPGVICGSATCPEGDQCCAGFGTSCVTPDAGCNMLTIAVPCDGDEDCTGTQECCVMGSSISNYSIVCVDQGTCASSGGTNVCVNSAECESTQACCSASALQSAGVELGWCVAGSC